MMSLIAKYIFRIFILIATFFYGQATMAQNLSGEINYERTSYWIKIMEELPYLSQAEKDRASLTWGDDDGYTSKYVLRFSQNEAVYTHGEEGGSNEDSGWTWRKDDYLIYRDFNNMVRKDWLDMLDRTYLVEDTLVFPKWKIRSEIKDIQGYVCMSAEMRDTIKKQHIVAWFTDEIPISAGPEMLGGLPGVILEMEVNGGAVIVTATDIDLKPLEDGIGLPKKMKGRKIDHAKYLSLIQSHLDDSIEAQRNPYWSLRY